MTNFKRMPKINVIRHFTLFLVLTLISINIINGQSPKIGMPYIQHFSPEEYGGGLLNYDITQDYRGYILVGNNKGIIEYDGTDWRLYDLKPNSRIRSLYSDVKGKVYLGTQNEIGYLWPNEKGQYQYHSLTHLIPEEYREFTEIWNIFPTKKGITFANVNGILNYDFDTISFTPFRKQNIQSFTFNGMIYNQVMEEGLLYFDNGEWKLSDQGQFFSDKEVRSICSFDENKNLVSTFENGIFLVSKHHVEPWAKHLQSVFSEHKILVTKRLRDGSYAIGTSSDGLYLLEEDGSVIHHFTKGKGLESRTILDVFEDSFGNIWVGQNNDVAKIEWNSPFRYLNEEIGVQGTGYAALATADYLYLGTNNGLFYSKLKDGNTTIFHKLQGLKDQVYNIQEINGDILVACHIGAYHITDHKAAEISPGVGWWGFIETEDPNIVIGGGYAGLFLLKRNEDSWLVEKYYTGFFESCRVMEFDHAYTLWMSHGYKGVYAIDFSKNYDSLAQINFYDSTSGFNDNFGINVFKVSGENIFTTTEGVFRYDPISQTFLHTKHINESLGEDANIRYLMQDLSGDIFFIEKDYTGILKKDNWGYTFQENPLNKIHPLLNDDLEHINILNNDVVVFAAREGFILYDKSYASAFSESLQLAIREIYLPKTDSVLFRGNFISDNEIVNDQPAQMVPLFEYDNNSINIKFSAIDFDNAPTQYRYRLDGLENKWSKWTSKTEKEYSKLSEGSYSFIVEARNSHDIHSPQTSYKFKILPPWYRAQWMLFIYTISFFGLSIWLIYYNRKNKKIITKQEKALITQDQQLKEVSEKSEAEISKLKNEKLMTEIKHKKSQLASTTMHLIDKNEFLQNIQKEIHELMQSSEQKVKVKLKRIVNEIEKNKNQENHWNQFEIHFDEVNDGFTKKLRKQFPDISPIEVKLSVYLRMNFSTKEIANLSHVTTRAVEMSRYRLRKKLNLNTETNLIDFLMKI
ncbi:MAG: triple tyrosine motif-containing protein [Cyclobacteriaceae bacterium]